MPVLSNLRADGRVATLTVSDPYNLDDWQDAMRQIIGHPTFRPDCSFLVDRRLAAPPSPAMVRAVIDALVSYQPRLGSIVIAIVATPEPASAGMMKMAETLMQVGGLTVEMRTFHDVLEAQAWLQERSSAER
jgi:hypothetical protein